MELKFLKKITVIDNKGVNTHVYNIITGKSIFINNDTAKSQKTGNTWQDFRKKGSRCQGVNKQFNQGLKSGHMRTLGNQN